MATTTANTARRLYFFDNLRVALTVLLVAHHVGQSYGPTGGWWPIMETARTPLLGPFFAVNRSFFMSLFFMIAGYFTVQSVDSKGPGAFIKERLLRLGIPVVVFALIMLPLQLFVFAPGARLANLEVGHLWFLEHLLLFSAVYALWRKLRPARPVEEPAKANPPKTLAILVFALALAVINAVVREWSPIDHWTYVLGFFRVALADVPRDLAFYIVGMVAYRRGWVSTFSSRAGRIWLAVGVAMAVLCYVYELALTGIVAPRSTVYDVAYPIWEMLLCCGMCIGLTVLFRDLFNTQGTLMKALSRAQYAAYLFHVPVILVFQALVLSLALPPLAKFALVTAVSVPATFLLCHWVRKPLHL